MVNFLAGAANAYGSDNLGGAGRQQQDTTAGKIGQATGDFVATVQGATEFVLGGTGVQTGMGLSATGDGALVGVPLIAVSVPVAIDGAVVATQGAGHLGEDAANAIHDALNKPAESRPQGPVKAKDAPGVTSGGQATDKEGNKLGPSGRPQINETHSNTREGAGNRALNEGSGKVEHPNPKRGQPHFHPTDNKGKKKHGSTHHNYPD